MITLIRLVLGMPCSVVRIIVYSTELQFIAVLLKIMKRDRTGNNKIEAQMTICITAYNNYSMFHVSSQLSAGKSST